MRISRLAVVAAVVSALCLAAAASASADSTSCTAAGTVKLSPGLTETPQVQNIQIKGTLSGCVSVESTVTEGKFQIHEKTAEKVTCKALTEGAASTEASITLKWKPKPEEGPNSAGSGGVSLVEGPAALTGTISSGPFHEDTLGGSLTQSYTGGATCGVPQGKKKAKKVNKGTVSGTLSIS
jgi:hypothetical protein